MVLDYWFAIFPETFWRAKSQAKVANSSFRVPAFVKNEKARSGLLILGGYAGTASGIRPG
ncbi:MAG: hypothetical protein D6714_18285 [Bacteroidetes bacterium]|nr:MAG: hypothetical protein D6714_18285 [Bacteroidota bacterium]